ncbi:MAG: hypothetical protein KIT09_08585 [Bryobacteraceae bacterium]|nr:hypothetical protein [Bryobacteraceae bacterium]
MTKVQLRFGLARALDEPLMERIANAHSIYGLHHVKLAPSLDEVTVEFDASRLTADEVESALRRAGIPVAKSLTR